MTSLRRLLFLAIAGKLMLEGAFATTGMEVFDPEASLSKRVTVATETVDDAFDVQINLGFVLEKELAEAGYQVMPEPEGAELVLVPTMGRISMPKGGAGSFFHGNSVAAKAAGKKEKHPAGVPSLATQNMMQCGLLITAYKVGDWEAMPLSGKVPSPVWRIYETIILPESSTDNIGEELVKKSLSHLSSLKSATPARTPTKVSPVNSGPGQ